MSQPICYLLIGNEELGNGQWHWYTVQSGIADCVYCGAFKTVASLTDKWKKYESA